MFKVVNRCLSYFIEGQWHVKCNCPYSLLKERAITIILSFPQNDKLWRFVPENERHCLTKIEKWRVKIKK